MRKDLEILLENDIAITIYISKNAGNNKFKYRTNPSTLIYEGNYNFYILIPELKTLFKGNTRKTNNKHSNFETSLSNIKEITYSIGNEVQKHYDFSKNLMKIEDLRFLTKMMNCNLKKVDK